VPTKQEVLDANVLIEQEIDEKVALKITLLSWILEIFLNIL
jgi:hypothetical protein